MYTPERTPSAIFVVLSSTRRQAAEHLHSLSLSSVTEEGGVPEAGETKVSQPYLCFDSFPMSDSERFSDLEATLATFVRRRCLVLEPEPQSGLVSPVEDFGSFHLLPRTELSQAPWTIMACTVEIMAPQMGQQPAEQRREDCAVAGPQAAKEPDKLAHQVRAGRGLMAHPIAGIV